jgi:hypothetical protein
VERDVDDVASDATWDRDARNETVTERLDRNWGDLLQELRVAQTGVQLLTGLLLTVPFQARFGDLTGYQRVLYLVALSLSAAATGLLIAPVALHRALFRQHARAVLVAWGQRFTIGGLALLGLAVTGVVVLIFDVVAGTTPAIVAGVVCVVVFGLLWGAIPALQRARL